MTLQQSSHAEFKATVERLVSRVPAGSVTTYGHVAALAGRPGAARVVGGMAHYGDDAVPWRRLVNRFGGLASGYPGGRRTQAEHLADEGAGCVDDIIENFDVLRWTPEELPYE